MATPRRARERLDADREGSVREEGDMGRWWNGWVWVAVLGAAGLASAQCPEVQSLSVVSNCVTEQVDVSWNNPVPYDGLVVLAIDVDLGVEVAEVTLPSLPGIPTPSEASLDLPPGNYNIQVVGVCPTAQSTTNRLHGHAVGFLERTNVLFSLESTAGLNNSAEEWGLFFGATSKSYVRLPSFTAICPDVLQPGDVVWVCCGTFPDNYVLTVDDGELLTEWVLSGVSVYLEGANVWGFDPLTPYADFDGVLGRTGMPSPIEDGDDSCQFISGLAHAGLDLTGWAEPYDQDQIGEDSTDRLVPTGMPGFPVDLSGPNAGLIIQKSGPPGPEYGVAIYYVPGGPAPLGLPIEGKRVSSSVELGKADDGTKQEVSLCLKG
ncbi:MAG: hypothetical protein AAF488_12215, partial [Planctomycetota bacterium]